MLDRRTDVESLGELFHKEKKQKKTTDKRSTDDSLLDNSSIVQGSTTVNSLSEQTLEHQNRRKAIGQQELAKRERLHKQTRNVEIDASLHGWIMEGLVDPAYASWVAKCCHSLSLEVVNRLAINARNGKTPQRLFSSLLKGNMNLKAKQDYYDMDTINPDAADSMRNRVGQ